MSRMENKMVMGFFAIDEKHHPAITSIVEPATPGHKLLDPYAGEGAFLDVAAKAWHMTPYANELDGSRAAQCIDRFGPKQAVRCDVERLSASTGAFSVGWFNPPYDHDRAADTHAKRVEFRFLRHSWKWIQPGGLVMWCVYQHHLTEHAMGFFAKHTSRVDVWGLPGKHMGTWDQIIVAAIPGKHHDPEAHYADIVDQKANPLPLTVQDEPVYKLPAPSKPTRFVFAPDMVDEAQGLRLLETYGAWANNGFQALLAPPPPPSKIVPIVAPRPGHTALVLAAGIADGMVVDTSTYGKVAIRGKTEQVEEVARVEVESDPKDPDNQIKKTVIKMKPSTTLTLLSENGTVVEMEKDEPLLDFIEKNKTALADHLNQQFDPLYQFDLNGLDRFLGRIRLNGKHPLYTAQKHIIAAITKGLEHRKGVLLSGQMGSGKTAMGSSVAAAIASGTLSALQDDIREDQIMLIVAPPHLLDKWKRELLSIHPNSIVARLNRHEQIKAFMEKAAKIGGQIPKIGLIKRDMTKLGSGWEPSVVWKRRGFAQWKPGEETPDGYEPQDRVKVASIPCCPACGVTVMEQKKKGLKTPASKTWLKKGKRACDACHEPLWQESRDRGARPKAGQKYPPKNPRYPLDQYIQRRYPDRVYMLVWDEVHEGANAARGNGQAFGRLAGVADKVLGLTGTPFNGKASSLFNIQYHINPRVRERYPWGGAVRFERKRRGSRGFQSPIEGTGNRRGDAESQWVYEMGVREKVLEERPQYDPETGSYTGTSTYERPYTEAAGISPLLVAEMLDSTVYFSLRDLGKALPHYEEIALPVEMEDDTYSQYDRTRQQLKDYLIARKWEGDNSFRGAYMHWSMDWPSAMFRECKVVHNIKSPITGKVRPHTVAKISSFGEDRIYAKEQALIDLVTEELAANRPCVVYVRQSKTKDIQPRLEKLLTEHVPGAKPYVLRSSIDPEKREKTIEKQRQSGVNIIITNPELVKTGMDLLWTPTLIFYEVTFRLPTMMQAAARAFRLNQTHKTCKTVYMYSVGTMEHTAVQLMSRKQRAAKLLTGDVGLTGLEAITEGEGGFEAALLDAIAKDDALVDPAQMLQTAVESEYDSEDEAFWNVEPPLFEPVGAETVPPLKLLPPKKRPLQTTLNERVVKRLKRAAHLDEAKLAKVAATVVGVLERGVEHPTDGALKLSEGVYHPDFAKYPTHAKQLKRWLKKYLRSKKAADPAKLDSLVDALIRVAANKAGVIPPQPKQAKAVKGKSQKGKRWKPDRMAVPDDGPPVSESRRRRSSSPDTPTQMLLFPMPDDYTG